MKITNKKEIDAFLKCAGNIKQFSKYVQITTCNGKTQFNPYRYQSRLLCKFAETYGPPSEKHNNIVVKSRQVGMTTALAVYVLWFALFHPDKYVGVLSCTVNNTKIIYDMIREIYDSLPEFLKIPAVKNNARNIRFDNGSTIAVAAFKSDSVHGRTIDLMVIDEAAWCKKSDFDDFCASVFPTLACRNYSQIILTSTPHGIDHGFYSIWEHAINNENSFIPTKVDWRCVPHRDDEWYRQMVDNYGPMFAGQELDAQFVGSTTF